VNELPENKYVQSEAKPRRQKFNVVCVRAIIEKMNEDSDSEFADNVVVTKANQAGPNKSAATAADAADCGVISPVKKKRKLASGGNSQRDNGSDSSEMGNEEDVEPEDVEPDVSPDDFINQVTTKLQIIASDLDIRDSEDFNRDRQTHKNKLSLKKTGVNSKNWEFADAGDRQNSRSLTGVANVTPTVAKQKPATMWSGEAMEDWDRIESLPDSDTDEPVNLQSEPAGVQATNNKLKSPATEMPKHGSSMLSSGVDKRKQTPVRQLVKPSSRPSKTLKYCIRSDMLDDSEEIAVEDDDSDEADENFLSLTGSSSPEESKEGRLPSRKLTSSFWLTSPQSKKSAFNTDIDDDDDDDEFVSNSTSR